MTFLAEGEATAKLKMDRRRSNGVRSEVYMVVMLYLLFCSFFAGDSELLMVANEWNVGITKIVIKKW
jgi:hypothetical protein